MVSSDTEAPIYGHGGTTVEIGTVVDVEVGSGEPHHRAPCGAATSLARLHHDQPGRHSPCSRLTRTPPHELSPLMNNVIAPSTERIPCRWPMARRPRTYSAKKVAVEHRPGGTERPATVLRPGAIQGPYATGAAEISVSFLYSYKATSPIRPRRSRCRGRCRAWRRGLRAAGTRRGGRNRCPSYRPRRAVRPAPVGEPA